MFKTLQNSWLFLYHTFIYERNIKRNIMRKEYVLKLSLFWIACHCLVAAYAIDLSFLLPGKEYTDLKLILLCDGSKSYTFAGHRTANTWAFQLPDSLLDSHYGIRLEVKDSIYHRLSFGFADGGKNIVEFSIDKCDKVFTAEYAHSDTLRNVAFFRNQDVVFDTWEMKDPTMEMQACRELIPVGYGIKDSPKALETYLSVIEKYADTHYCAAQLYSKLHFFADKEAAGRAYRLLSEKRRKEYFGRKIHRYLFLEQFPDIQLPTTIGGESKALSLLPDGYTLVVFGSSWCKPCLAEIPILRRIDERLSGHPFRILLISMDEAHTVENWQARIKEQSLPWISYLGYARIEEIKDLYTIQAYPTSYLVFPDKTFIQIDVRKEESRLYNLISK